MVPDVCLHAPAKALRQPTTTMAKTMAATLASGRLLTYDGFGHVSYGGRSACIDADVRRYFITGDAPAPDTHCS